MSMCFRDAFQAKKDMKITESEYLSQLIAHFRGVRHKEDHVDDADLCELDPFAASIREMALNPKMETLQNTMTYENLFNNCLIGDFKKVKFSLEGLLKQGSIPVPLSPLATLAASKGHADIFKLCFDKGARDSQNIDRAAENGSNSDVLRILAKHKLDRRNYENSLEKPETDPDGGWSARQIDKWFGDIKW